MKYEEYINKLGFTDEELMIISDVNKKCREYFPEELSFARTAYDKGEEGFAEYLSEFSEKSDIGAVMGFADQSGGIVCHDQSDQPVIETKKQIVVQG